MRANQREWNSSGVILVAAEIEGERADGMKPVISLEQNADLLGCEEFDGEIDEGAEFLRFVRTTALGIAAHDATSLACVVML